MCRLFILHTYIHLEGLGDQEYFSLIPTIDSLDKYSDVGFLKYTWRLKGLRSRQAVVDSISDHISMSI